MINTSLVWKVSKTFYVVDFASWMFLVPQALFSRVTEPLSWSIFSLFWSPIQQIVKELFCHKIKAFHLVCSGWLECETAQSFWCVWLLKGRMLVGSVQDQVSHMYCFLISCAHICNNVLAEIYTLFSDVYAVRASVFVKIYSLFSDVYAHLRALVLKRRQQL